MTIDLFLCADKWAMSMLRVVVQGALGFALIWACSKIIARMSPSTRCSLWWLGCAAMLAGAMNRPVTLHLLPARAPQAMVQASADASAAPVMPPLVPAEPALRQADAAAPQPAVRRGWLLSLEAVWSVGVLLGVIRLLCGLVRADTLTRESKPVNDPRMLSLLRDLSDRLGLKSHLHVRLSEDRHGPQVVWAWGRAVILLPYGVMPLEAAGSLRLALAHELAHVRRGDLSFGWIPALAELIFWFDPLVHIAAREYRQAREEACDADALRVTQGDPSAYARLLLRFGIRPAPHQIAASGAASSIAALRRRLVNLDASAPRVPPIKRFALGLAAALACALPCVRLVAQQAASTPDTVAPVTAPIPQPAIPAAAPPDAAPAPPPPSQTAPVARRPQRHTLPPMPVYALPASPERDHARRTELDESTRVRASLTPQERAMWRREADEARRDVQRITPQERAAWQQAIAASREEAMSARGEARTEALKSQTDALAQSEKVRRQLAFLRSQAFKRAMAGIDQAHLGKTLSEALKSVPGNIDTAQIERQVDAALKNLPKEIDVPDGMPPAMPTVQTGKKIVIDQPGRYVIPKGSGVIIDVTGSHVHIDGDTITVDK